MYIPKYCPECGEGRHPFVETKPDMIGCQMCGMEFGVTLLYDIDSTTFTIKDEKSCNTCGTKNTTRCS